MFVVPMASKDDRQKQKMLSIINDLKKRIDELDKFKEGIESKKIKLSASPKRSREILEEIKVPSLQILKEGSAKQ